LVEDHDLNRQLLTEMLERCGQSVALAHDGNEAISMVIDSVMRGRSFDIVLMDIQMPACDGYAATRAIRAEGIGPEDLPIIALTANAFPEDIAEARSAGMQEHLAKPIAFATLARALQRWLPTRIVEAAPSALGQAQGRAIATDRRERSAGLPRFGGSSRRGGPPSPALRRRWQSRRREAIHAVREALEDGGLAAEGAANTERRAAIGRQLHRLAGTAAIFGEALLGDKAAALERALAMDHGGAAKEALARELLTIADDSRAQQGWSAQNGGG
jgi:CheY-like chemotaxis protein